VIEQPTKIFGIFVPTSDPNFLRVVYFHIILGIVCVATGALAMLSKKERGKHSKFGAYYFWSVVVLVVSGSILAFMRWQQSWHLFVIGLFVFLFAWIGRLAIRKNWQQRFRIHIPAFGLSYILMLIAFYVDNGPHLPLWKNLNPFLYWLLPIVIGVPLALRAMVKYRNW